MQVLLVGAREMSVEVAGSTKLSATMKTVCIRVGHHFRIIIRVML
jgi:hypothetical protein